MDEVVLHAASESAKCDNGTFVVIRSKFKTYDKGRGLLSAVLLKTSLDLQADQNEDRNDPQCC